MKDKIRKIIIFGGLVFVVLFAIYYFNRIELKNYDKYKNEIEVGDKEYSKAQKELSEKINDLVLFSELNGSKNLKVVKTKTDNYLSSVNITFDGLDGIKEINRAEAKVASFQEVDSHEFKYILSLDIGSNRVLDNETLDMLYKKAFPKELKKLSFSDILEKSNKNMISRYVVKGGELKVTREDRDNNEYIEIVYIKQYKLEGYSYSKIKGEECKLSRDKALKKAKKINKDIIDKINYLDGKKITNISKDDEYYIADVNISPSEQYSYHAFLRDKRITEGKRIEYGVMLSSFKKGDDDYCYPTQFVEILKLMPDEQVFVQTALNDFIEEVRKENKNYSTNNIKILVTPEGNELVLSISNSEDNTKGIILILTKYWEEI